MELYDRFPDECGHVIKAFKVIFHNDKVAREEAMSAEARLAYLNQLQRGAADATKHPDRWLPWNYRENVSATSDAA